MAGPQRRAVPRVRDQVHQGVRLLRLLVSAQKTLIKQDPIKLYLNLLVCDCCVGPGGKGC